MCTLALWKESADTPLMLIHMSFATGTVCGPLIVHPFLTDSSEPFANVTTQPPYVYIDDMLNKELQFSQFSAGFSINESRIEIAYFIGASLSVASAILLITSFVIGPPKTFQMWTSEAKSIKEVLSISKATHTKLSFAVPISLLLIVYYICLSGSMMVLTTWLFTYAVESDLPFTSQEAAILDASVRMATMFGRACNAILSHGVPIQPLLLISALVSAAMALGLTTLGTNTKTSLYVFACGYTAMASGLWPGAFVWLDKYLVVTSIVVLASCVGGGAGSMLFQWLVGWLFASKEPEAFMYVIFGCAALLCVVLLIMQVCGSKYGSRYRRNDTENVEQETTDKHKCSLEALDIYTSANEDIHNQPYNKNCATNMDVTHL